MNVCIASRHQFTGDALQLAFARIRPSWRVTTYTIRHAAFGEALAGQLQQEGADLLLLEMNGAHWSFYAGGLRTLQGRWPVVLLLDELLADVVSKAKELDIENIQSKDRPLESFLQSLTGQSAASPPEKVETLSEESAAVLDMLCAGHSAEFICRKRNLSAAMLDCRLQQIFRYLDVSDTQAAVAQAFNKGVIRLD